MPDAELPTVAAAVVNDPANAKRPPKGARTSGVASCGRLYRRLSAPVRILL